MLISLVPVIRPFRSTGAQGHICVTFGCVGNPPWHPGHTVAWIFGLPVPSPWVLPLLRVYPEKGHKSLYHWICHTTLLASGPHSLDLPGMVAVIHLRNVLFKPWVLRALKPSFSQSRAYDLDTQVFHLCFSVVVVGSPLPKGTAWKKMKGKG
jgi:hypothetical protein